MQHCSNSGQLAKAWAKRCRDAGSSAAAEAVILQHLPAHHVRYCQNTSCREMRLRAALQNASVAATEYMSASAHGTALPSISVSYILPYLYL